MNEEIELKFIVQLEMLPALRQRLLAMGHDGHALRQLTNTYFEPDGFDLRRHGIGLRIRQVDGQCGMTMKTAGQVIGGLHQHPEFNVPLPGPTLDRGEVSAGALHEPICELGMELLGGNPRDLFAFASTLSDAGGLRLGSLSKAARGYHLQQGNPPRAIRTPPLLNPPRRRRCRKE